MQKNHADREISMPRLKKVAQSEFFDWTFFPSLYLNYKTGMVNWGLFKRCLISRNSYGLQDRQQAKTGNAMFLIDS